MKKNNSQITFLDILMKKSGNSLNTDIYYKPTDSKSYLDFNSCHPRNTKTNVRYNLLEEFEPSVTTLQTEIYDY